MDESVALMIWSAKMSRVCDHFSSSSTTSPTKTVSLNHSLNNALYSKELLEALFGGEPKTVKATTHDSTMRVSRSNHTITTYHQDE